jgi:hypothetical protein
MAAWMAARLEPGERFASTSCVCWSRECRVILHFLSSSGDLCRSARNWVSSTGAFGRVTVDRRCLLVFESPDFGDGRGPELLVGEFKEDLAACVWTDGWLETRLGGLGSESWCASEGPVGDLVVGEDLLGIKDRGSVADQRLSTFPGERLGVGLDLNVFGSGPAVSKSGLWSLTVPANGLRFSKDGTRKPGTLSPFVQTSRLLKTVS